MNRLMIRGAAAALLGGAVLATAPAAMASDAQFPGSAGKLTMWEDDSYKGHVESRASYDTNFSNDAFDDQLSSFVNKTGNWWILYEDNTYGGAKVCVKPHSHDANIGGDTKYEDDISSVKMFGTSKPSGCTDTTGTTN